MIGKKKKKSLKGAQPHQEECHASSPRQGRPDVANICKKIK